MNNGVLNRRQVQGPRQLKMRRHVCGVALGDRHEHVGRGEDSIQRICQDHWEIRCEQIDIELQVARTVDAIDHERTATLVGRGDQIQGQFPRGLTGNGDHMRKLGPVKMKVAFGVDCLIAGLGLELKLEGIEIVAAEGGYQHGAQLIEIAGHFQFLDGAADGKVIDDDLPLIDGALGHAPQFTELEIVEMLDAKPNAGADNG